MALMFFSFCNRSKGYGAREGGWILKVLIWDMAESFFRTIQTLILKELLAGLKIRTQWEHVQMVIIFQSIYF